VLALASDATVCEAWDHKLSTVKATYDANVVLNP
jgi:hypothetical protein